MKQTPLGWVVDTPSHDDQATTLINLLAAKYTIAHAF